MPSAGRFLSLLVLLVAGPLSMASEAGVAAVVSPLRQVDAGAMVQVLDADHESIAPGSEYLLIAEADQHPWLGQRLPARRVLVRRQGESLVLLEDQGAVTDLALDEVDTIVVESPADYVQALLASEPIAMRVVKVVGRQALLRHDGRVPAEALLLTPDGSLLERQADDGTFLLLQAGVDLEWTVGTTIELMVGAP